MTGNFDALRAQWPRPDLSKTIEASPGSEIVSPALATAPALKVEVIRDDYRRRNGNPNPKFRSGGNPP
jgi:hypothetical protein